MIDHRETFVALQKWREAGTNPMVSHIEALRIARMTRRRILYKHVLAWIGYQLSIIGNDLQERYGPVNLGSVTEAVDTQRGVAELRF
jgi:hypothetical protein